MDIGRREIMPQCKHGQQRGISGFVAKVILEFTTGQFRTRSRFGSNVSGLFPIQDSVAHKGEADSSKIGTATKATDNHVGIFACHFHLLFGFQTDNRLMQCDMA